MTIEALITKTKNLSILKKQLSKRMKQKGIPNDEYVLTRSLFYKVSDDLYYTIKKIERAGSNKDPKSHTLPQSIHNQLSFFYHENSTHRINGARA